MEEEIMPTVMVPFPFSVPLPEGVVLRDTLSEGPCTVSQGHCFGSDGGTGGLSLNSVLAGRGGNKDVWTLNDMKMSVIKREQWTQCQYCQRFVYVKDLSSAI